MKTARLVKQTSHYRGTGRIYELSEPMSTKGILDEVDSVQYVLVSSLPDFPGGPLVCTCVMGLRSEESDFPVSFTLIAKAVDGVGRYREALRLLGYVALPFQKPNG